MPVDTSIYNGFLAPPKSALDYQNEFMGAQAQRQKIQQNAIGLQGAQASLADAQRVRDEQTGIRNALSTLPPTSTPDDQVKALRALGTPTALTTADTLATSYGNQQVAAATAKEKTSIAGKNDNETSIAKHQQHLQALAAVNTPEDAVQWALDGVKSGALPADGLPQALQKIGAAAQRPGGLDQWKSDTAKVGQTIQQQMEMTTPKPTEMRLGNVVKMLDTNPHSQTYGKEVVPAQQIGESPDTAATTAATRRGQDISQQTQYTLAGLGPDGKDAAGGTGGLSPAAIENAAARYNTDGTLPPSLGRGQQGARDIRSIQNRAAELAMGTDPTQLRVNQLDAKSASGALTQLTKAQTMASSFENTANQNADLALKLSSKLPRTGVPLLNSAIQAVRTGTGSPEATQFAAANETFVNEYAKIMSGGMGNAATSDAASNRAHSLLSTAMTPEQYEGNVKLLQQEMKNRMKGYDDQVQAVKSRIGGKSTAAPAASGAADSSGWHVEVVK
jgi:hypothetical protein